MSLNAKRSSRPGRPLTTPQSRAQDTPPRLWDDFTEYREPPAVPTRGPLTSHLAAHQAPAYRSKLKREVYAYLVERGVIGATDDEIWQAMPHALLGSVTKRRGEIVADGLVINTGQLRRNRRNSWSIVWAAAEAVDVTGAAS